MGIETFQVRPALHLMQKRNMRTFSLLIVLFFCSCSAKWHYKKAIKKGLEITTKSDTIRITTIDSIPVIKHDTIVYEKYFTSKDTVVYYKDVYVPKTIREITCMNKEPNNKSNNKTYLLFSKQDLMESEFSSFLLAINITDNRDTMNIEI